MTFSIFYNGLKHNLNVIIIYLFNIYFIVHYLLNNVDDSFIIVCVEVLPGFLLTPSDVATFNKVGNNKFHMIFN